MVHCMICMSGQPGLGNSGNSPIISQVTLTAAQNYLKTQAKPLVFRLSELAQVTLPELNFHLSVEIDAIQMRRRSLFKCNDSVSTHKFGEQKTAKC